MQVSTSEDLYSRAQEYNKSLQQYNSKLQTDLEITSESLKRVEMEKLTIVENLGTLRGHNKALQDQLTSLKVISLWHMFLTFVSFFGYFLCPHLKYLLCFGGFVQASHEDGVKQKETLVNELKCLRGELQQVREDRDRQVAQVQALTADLEKHKEFSVKSYAELDVLMMKSDTLEVCS